MSVYNQPPVN